MPAVMTAATVATFAMTFLAVVFAAAFPARWEWATYLAFGFLGIATGVLAVLFVVGMQG